MDISAHINLSEELATTKGPKKGIGGLNILIPYYTNYLNFIERLYNQYGPVVYFEAGSEKIFLINDPGFIEHILITNPDNYKRGTGFTRLRMLLGEGLLSSDGEMNKKHRVMLQPSFHKSSVQTYMEIMKTGIKESINIWRGKKYIDIQKESVDLYLKIIARVLFGKENEKEFVKLGKFFDSLTYDYKATVLIGLPILAKKLPFSWVKDFFALNSKLDDLLYTTIRKRKENIGDDIVSLLINAEDESGNKLTYKEIRDELATLFFAAYDTSARTLTWALYLLSKNKNILAKFRLLEKDPDAFDEYSNMIISEALRIYPPAHSITRIAEKEDRYLNSIISEGSSIIISPYLIHRDEAFFANAMDFVPERWLAENRKNLKRMSYLPFGAGKRSCMGEAFARMQVSMALKEICRTFDFDITGNARESASLTLKPAGKLKLFLKERPNG